MGLLNLLRSDEKAAIDAAWRKYALLLEADSDKPAAVAQLKAMMQTLGKTTADVESDLRTLHTARRHLSIVADGSGLESEQAAAAKAVADYVAETECLIMEREREFRRLQDVAYQLSARQGAARTNAREFLSLKHDNSQLLAHIEPVSPL